MRTGNANSILKLLKSFSNTFYSAGVCASLEATSVAALEPAEGLRSRLRDMAQRPLREYCLLPEKHLVLLLSGRLVQTVLLDLLIIKLFNVDFGEDR